MQSKASALKELSQLIAQFEAISTPVTEFQSNAGGQERFEQTQAHEIIFSGGNSSGKTYCGLIKCAHHILPEKDINGKNTGYTIHPHRRIRIKPGGNIGMISSWSEKVQRSNIEPLVDKILGPYEKNKKIEAGVRQWSEFETGNIHFMWQTQSTEGYKGIKVDFAHLDEPHKAIIYNETKSRLFARKGTMWNTATFVADDQYSDLQLADIMWMQEEIIAPWMLEPSKFPLTEIIFVSTEENEKHLRESGSSIEYIEKMLANVSVEERTTRMTGHIVTHFGQCCFDEDKLIAIQNYLAMNPEVSEPKYGSLEYDSEGNWDNEWKVVFRERNIETFPEKPKGEYIIKIWQHPIRKSGIFMRPEYFIGVDAAEGKRGGDYTSVSVIRGDNGEEVAALHGHISEIELAKQLYLLGVYYCTHDDKPAMLGIETNNIGKTTMSYLINGHADLQIPKYGLDRLYHRPPTSNMEKGVMISGGTPGWLTTAATRHYLVTAMRKIILEAWEDIQQNKPCIIRDRSFISEARWFVLNKNGKYEAKAGVSQDDRLFSRAIAEKVREQYARKAQPMTGLLENAYKQKDLYWVQPDGKIMVNPAAMQRREFKRRLYL